MTNRFDMQNQLRIDAIQRMLDLVDQQACQIGEQGTVAVADYVDPTMLDRELDAIFSCYPIVVGHVSQLEAEGAFLTVDVGRVPVLVNRDRSGSLHAFVNSCRHRGARLVSDDRGSAKAFKCPYHGWTYLDCGSLNHVPRPEAFPGLDRSQCGLVELSVMEAGGFAWVTTGTPAKDAQDGLSAVADDLDHFGLADHVVRASCIQNRLTNWKLIIDAFSEGYHVKSLHNDSVRNFFLDDGVIFDQLGNHSRSIGARKEITAAKQTETDSWDFRSWTTAFYTVFPNTILVFHPDWISRMTIFPDGVDRSIVHHDMLVPKDADLQSSHWDRTFALINDQVIAAEDMAMCEQIQTVSRAGADQHWQLGGVETPVLWFHQACWRALSHADCP